MDETCAGQEEWVAGEVLSRDLHGAHQLQYQGRHHRQMADQLMVQWHVLN